jgi:antitoxin MazE
LRRNLWPCLFN